MTEVGDTRSAAPSATNHATCPCCGGPVGADELLIDEGSRTVARGGVTAILTVMELALLRYLDHRRPGVASKSDIYDDLYAFRPNTLPDPKIVDIYVCKLRPKLRPLGLEIETIWGTGYKLVDASAGNDGLTGAQRRREVRVVGDRRDVEIRDHHAAGCVLTEIARRMGLSYAFVAHRLDRLGLSRGVATPGQSASMEAGRE